VAVCPDADTCVTLGMAPVMLERGGLTVAIWSLADPRTYRFMPEPAKAAVKLTGELDAVARAMLEYPEGRDLDLLVLHGGEDAAKTLAAAVPGFDVIVFGHDQVVLGAERVGDTIIASAGGNGALVGVMTLRVDESGTVALLESRARSFDRERDPQYRMARELADDAIAWRSASVSAPAVFAAGLADGVNPCALSILALLVALLARRKKRSMLAVGLGFVAGTFAAYFLAGLGLLSALAALGMAVGSRAYATVALVIRVATALACAVLAVLSLIDAARAFVPGGGSRFILQLPEAAKRRAKDLVYAYTKEDGSKKSTAVFALAAGALALGFSTSIFELACTGQVYLPTLAYMAGAGKEGALGYLFIYNGAFILPALAVFLATFLGLHSRTLGKFMVHYMGFAKLALALVFAGLAVFIILG
jgi:cytochrome c biogenesis protein CcdA